MSLASLARAAIVLAIPLSAGPALAQTQEPIAAFNDAIAKRFQTVATPDERRKMLETMAQTGQQDGANAAQVAAAGLALTALAGGDMARGCPLFGKAAQMGFVPAMHLYGECFSNSVLTQDAQQNIVYWYTKAAEGGNWSSLCALGELRMKGKILPSDPQRGMAECQNAAENGSTGAQLTIGDMFRTGTLVQEDPAAAAGWYRLAYESGDTRGASKLAFMHFTKQYYQESTATALSLAEEAARKGDTLAALMAADFLMRALAEDETNAEARLTGPEGWRSYYWSRRAFERTSDDQVREGAEKILRIILSNVSQETLSGWEARYPETLPSAM